METRLSGRRAGVGEEDEESYLEGAGEEGEVGLLVEELGGRLLSAVVEHRGVDLLGVALAGGELQGVVTCVEVDLLDLVVVHHVEELGVGDARDLSGTKIGVDRLADREVGDDRNQDVEQHRAAPLVLVHVHRWG